MTITKKRGFPKKNIAYNEWRFVLLGFMFIMQIKSPWNLFFTSIFLQNRVGFWGVMFSEWRRGTGKWKMLSKYHQEIVLSCSGHTQTNYSAMSKERAYGTKGEFNKVLRPIHSRGFTPGAFCTCQYTRGSVFKFAQFAPGVCSQIFNRLNIRWSIFRGENSAPEDEVYPWNRW